MFFQRQIYVASGDMHAGYFVHVMITLLMHKHLTVTLTLSSDYQFFLKAG